MNILASVLASFILMYMLPVSARSADLGNCPADQVADEQHFEMTGVIEEIRPEAPLKILVRSGDCFIPVLVDEVPACGVGSVVTVSGSMTVAISATDNKSEYRFLLETTVRCVE